MVQEVGIISWLIYFLLDNKSLSVFTESSTRQNSSLVFKAKLHSSITSTINNSKKLNSVIARALDEISEEINLTNNLASIIIDDSILSHSIIIKSKKPSSKGIFFPGCISLKIKFFFLDEKFSLQSEISTP